MVRVATARAPGASIRYLGVRQLAVVATAVFSLSRSCGALAAGATATTVLRMIRHFLVRSVSPRPLRLCYLVCTLVALPALGTVHACVTPRRVSTSGGALQAWHVALSVLVTSALCLGPKGLQVRGWTNERSAPLRIVVASCDSADQNVGSRFCARSGETNGL